MFFERFGKVVVDDDLVIVQHDVADQIFHESLPYAYILHIAAYRSVQKADNFFGSYFDEGSLLFPLNIEVELRDLCFEFFQPLLCLFRNNTLFDSGNQIARGFKRSRSFCFKRFYIGIVS